MRQSRRFYGWDIAALSAVGVSCNFTLLVASTTGIFAAPIGAELGWSRETIFFALFFASIPAPLMAPLVGALIDRHGARRVIAISYAIQVLILLSFHSIGGSPVGFYVRYGLLATLCMGTTNIAFARLISLWFVRRRGLALGVVLAGIGFGGALWSLTTQWLIESFGWRNAYVGMAIIVAAMIAPILLRVRDTPASMGLQPDGDFVPAGVVITPPALTGVSLREAAGTGQYWLMIAAFLLAGIGLKAIQDNMVPLLVSRGETARLAASAQASLWISITFGRVFTGWLLDRFFAPRVAAAFLLAPILGMALLIFTHDIRLFFVAAMLIGLSVGSEIDVIAYLTARYFGLKQYSRIYGTFYATFGIAAFLGPYPAAWISTHNPAGYMPVLWAAMALIAAGIGLLLVFQRYPRVEPA